MLYGLREKRNLEQHAHKQAHTCFTQKLRYACICFKPSNALNCMFTSFENQLCLTRQHEMGKLEYLFYSCVLLFTVFLMSVHGSEDKPTATDATDEDDDNSEPGYNLPGGKFPIDDETELNELVARVKTNLKKLGDTENGPNLEFIRIKSAEYRVVTGFIYTLVAEINENKASTDCTINLWEKPWLDFVKLDIECGDEKRKYHWKSREDPDEIKGTSTATSTAPSSCN